MMARPHTQHGRRMSGSNKTFQITSNPDITESGPANSPDLNPIEQGWGYMKTELERSKPRSIRTLKRKMQQIWANVDEEFVQKQAEGMEKRLKSIIESRGEFTAN